MTDEVAIVTKARENIIFAMSALDEENRKGVSTQKHQLIHKCSFNGQACNIDKLVFSSWLFRVEGFGYSLGITYFNNFYTTTLIFIRF